MSLNFEKKHETSGFGKFVGFLLSYGIFTTILYFMLKILNKLPENVGYIQIMILTLYLIVIGILIGKIIE